jgi:hypothetical protein
MSSGLFPDLCADSEEKEDLLGSNLSLETMSDLPEIRVPSQRTTAQTLHHPFRQSDEKSFMNIQSTP